MNPKKIQAFVASIVSFFATGRFLEKISTRENNKGIPKPSIVIRIEYRKNRSK